MNKRSYLVLTLIILFSLVMVSCGGRSVPPDIASETEADETPKPQGAPGDENQEDETYLPDSLPPDQACKQEDIMLVVEYDHLWTWSPDGTEATGYYTGTANGAQRVILSQTGGGVLDGDAIQFSYEQSGIIQGDPDQCRVSGSGWAELLMTGTCENGVLTLEWMEVATGNEEATMVCDGKSTGFNTYYPPQAEFGIEIDQDGWAYTDSDTSLVPLFRSISMEWTIRVVPEGQSY